MASSDYKVELVDSSGQADMTVSVVGDQVVDLTGASPGDVLTIQGDGTVAPDPPAVVDLSAYVPKSLYDANTVLIATADDTPAALTVAASTIVGRKAAGGISAMSVAETKTLLAYVVGDIPTAAPVASPTFTGTVTAPLLRVDAQLGVGTAVVAPRMITVLAGGAHPDTTTTLYGAHVDINYPATTTVAAYDYYARVRTAAAAFTLPVGAAYQATTPIIGATSALTTSVAFAADNMGAAGVTNAYGINIAAQSGAATLNVGARIDSGTTCALWVGGNAAGTTVAGGVAFGSGRDVALFRSGAAAAALTGSLAVSGNFAANGVAVSAPLAWTQTYATADRTVANATVAAVATTASGLSGFGYSTSAQADSIPVNINALAADVLQLKKNVTALVDALQTAGLAT